MTYLPENLSELWLIAGGFDDLLLNGDTTDADGNSYTIDAIDDGATWDTPQPVDLAVQRWMTDGAVAATQGHENRTPSLQIRVGADTSVELAAAESALVKRSARPCLLKWVPPEGDPDAPSSVFEVWTWHLTHTLNGSDERRLERFYTLTFTAKPWVRSEGLTLSPAPAAPGGPTTISIDNCNAVTGWTGSSPTSSGGAVRGSLFVTGVEPHTVTLTRTGTVTGLGSLPYLIVDASINGGYHDSLIVKLGSVTLALVASVGTVGYYALPAGTTSFTSLSVYGTLHLASPGSTGTIRLIVNDVSATDTIGGVGSRKQLSRRLEVGGSVKTSGSIYIASPSATVLGSCLVYTCPDGGGGYTPPLRQFRTSGNAVSPDGTAASGNTEALVTSGASAGTITYTIPAGQLPEGQYVIVGRFVFGVSATLKVTVASGGSSTTGSVPYGGAAVTWGVVGSIALPATRRAVESQASTVITVSATANTGTHSVDELYVLDVTRGAFTLVTANGTATQMWIDAPDVDPVRNTPAIYSGSQADRSDAAAPTYSTVLSVGDHDLNPDGAMLFTVTDGVNDAAASASFYRRWHTHAGN